ncbi:ARM repeat superfamily protein [Arabidopsis thaliana]|jgi:hypothetical protein|uniref:ARM repeat superfamily protein n=1 Tax=Arabidopsis thaliana TaxID=3702 RepID=Q1PE83_ARATH|nr:ARM repeat superfamily protein [Arabidopsis thaliana]ABE66066.1 hypothetical protein At4g14280 [Arabidopsis thaliana]AEE83409.1 ARM repeat superfamily protein [Arabidopsis thaliana]|eukprot:NP_193164.2 ARM repeat superfamily protein [Arabidopsis thaliana]
MVDRPTDVVVEVGSSGRTIFRPDETPTPEPRRPTQLPPVPAPEKKLTLFALRLAVLEKIASGLGSLGFVWATVVLLGGFAGSLEITDFWFVTVILVIEGARLFSRSHELELQHQSKYTISGINIFRFLVKQINQIFHQVAHIAGDDNRPSVRETRTVQRNSGHITRTRTWKSSDVPMLPYTGWVFVSRNVSRIFYWLQIASAFASIFISTIQLIKQDYGGNDLKPKSTNLHAALTLFYSLALAEALLFLVEKAYWEYMISVIHILEKVNEECGLERFGTGSVRRFFYDAYSRCLNGSIFDGLKMDMVIFAMELLVANSLDEQLIGAEILSIFSTHDDYSVDTLQKIGTNLAIIERLVEMLNWRDKNQEDVRMSAAEILSRLASKKQNSLRVAGIPGAIESISSLLESTRDSGEATDEIGEQSINHSNLWTLNNLGLLILKRLARDHENCGKIGKTKGLLSKIIDFTYAEKNLLENPNVAVAEPYKILAVKRSLKLLKKLVSTTGTTGKNLRMTISGIVFTVSNIRETLHHGKSQPHLQKLGAEILTFLAFEEGATEKIGGTGGVLKGLLCIFLNNEIPKDKSGVRVSAGESVAMLAQGSKSNCQKILRANVLKGLVEALDNPLIRLNAARILRNLCAYTAPGQFNEQMKEVIKSAGATVLKAIKSEERKPQEVMVGLAPHILKLMNTPEELRGMFEEAGVTEEELAKALINILKRYEQPVPKVPRIRRFAIELTIAMMKANVETVKTFQNLEMKNELETVFETAAELENFDIFSGTVGLARHGSTINELIEEAMLLLR